MVSAAQTNARSWPRRTTTHPNGVCTHIDIAAQLRRAEEHGEAVGRIERHVVSRDVNGTKPKKAAPQERPAMVPERSVGAMPYRSPTADERTNSGSHNARPLRSSHDNSHPSRGARRRRRSRWNASASRSWRVSNLSRVRKARRAPTRRASSETGIDERMSPRIWSNRAGDGTRVAVVAGVTTKHSSS